MDIDHLKELVDATLLEGERTNEEGPAYEALVAYIDEQRSPEILRQHIAEARARAAARPDGPRPEELERSRLMPEQIRQLCWEYFRSGVAFEATGEIAVYDELPYEDRVKAGFENDWKVDESQVGRVDGKTGAVIVLSDGDEPGAVTCRIEFFPPANTESGTPAQLHAIDVMQRSVEMAERSSVPKATTRKPRRKR